MSQFEHMHFIKKDTKSVDPKQEDFYGRVKISDAFLNESYHTSALKSTHKMGKKVLAAL